MKPTARNSVLRHISFNERDNEAIDELKEGGGYDYYATCMRDAIVLARQIQKAQISGFTELVAENHETGERRILSPPSFKKPKRRTKHKRPDAKT